MLIREKNIYGEKVVTIFQKKKKSMERCYNFWKKEIGRKGDADILFINVWNFSRSKKWNFDYVENRIRFGERIEFVES